LGLFKQPWSTAMRAIVIKQYGGPEVLAIEERPIPEPKPGHVIVEVKAFGLNRAETYMRSGAWGDVAEISGIECVGVVRSDPEGRFVPGQKVTALMGGMGRLFNGSYAELTRVSSANVVPIATNLPWEDLAAIPESYATAWSGVCGNLALSSGQTLVVRGATSALGQAAINIAADLGARVIATTRNARRRTMLEGLGANEVLLESPELSKRVRELHPKGVDAVLDIVGNSTVLDSLAMARRGGRVCVVGIARSRRLHRQLQSDVSNAPCRGALQLLRQLGLRHARIPSVGRTVPGHRRSGRGWCLQGPAGEGVSVRGHPASPSVDGVQSGKRQDRRAAVGSPHFLAHLRANFKVHRDRRPRVPEKHHTAPVVRPGR
jgi:NADPH:quinone reductase